MRRLLLVLLLLVGGLGASAQADPLAGPTRVAEQAVDDTTAACRRDTPLADEQCGGLTEADLAAYEKSPTHRALGLQFHLADDVPFRHAPWIGTHNSFNNTARAATVSGLDSNQQLSLTDQLRSDMRTLEVDAHWFPSALAGGANAAVACHARGADQGHAGCSTEPLLATPLAEVATWLKGHPGEVVLLYLEDHLDTDEGYAQGAALVRDAFGSLLYAPGGTACTPLPLDGTRDDVLAAGKQVLVISGCHSGAGWNGAVFSGEARAKAETGAAGYNGSCDPARPPAAYDDRLLRVFEDATALSATVDQGREPITAERARLLQRCAVDITGFDELLPGDDRLAASVWSWAPGEPVATGDCAVQRADGWHAASCAKTASDVRACPSAGGWTVAKGCPAGTPRYGYEGVQLAAAMATAGASEVRLGLRRAGDRWVTSDPAR